MRLMVNGIALNVETMGEGAPLLLLHGFTGSMENWRPFLPVWQERLRLVLVDIIGHGRSDAPRDPQRYSVEHAANDIVAVLDKLGIANAHVLGYSMGGRLALRLAVDHPERVRTLVLESASPGLRTSEERRQRSARDEALARKIEREGLRAFIRYWENIPLFATQKRLPDDVRQALREQRLRNSVTGLTGSLRGMGTGIQPSLWKHIEKLNIPTLIMAGELDGKFCRIAAEMYECLPCSKLCLIPGVGHCIHIEAPEVFAGKVIRYVRSSDRDVQSSS